VFMYEVRPESKFRLAIGTSKIYISKKKNLLENKVKMVRYFFLHSFHRYSDT